LKNKIEYKENIELKIWQNKKKIIKRMKLKSDRKKNGG
jgi:hypothetical protein